MRHRRKNQVVNCRQMQTHSPMRSRYLAVDLKYVALVRGERQILRNLQWRIRPGEHWLLEGANGAGKTQLLKLIAGDVWPLPGRRTQRIYHWRGERSSEPLGIKDEIAYVGAERQDRYQHYGWNHGVATIVGTGFQRSDTPLRALTLGERVQVEQLLRRLGIVSLAKRRFLTLSLGERRLVLLARALAWRPALLLLDEPLNGLDAYYRRRVLNILSSLRRRTLPWIYATHRPEEAPAGTTHRARLIRGRLHTGTPRTTPSRVPLRVRSHRVRVARAAMPPQKSRRSRKPIFKLRNVWVWREGRAVLRQVTLHIETGDCWVIHGANGSGKSTLLATLHGDHGIASHGHIERSGYVPGAPLQEFQRHVGSVAPELQRDLPRRLKALEIVVAGQRNAFDLDGAPTAGERLAAMRALRGVDAQDLAKLRYEELSYGQARRVLFARALSRDPDILLLDEPYTGLDAPVRKQLIGLVETLASKELTVVIATHHRDEWPQRTTHELELVSGAVLYCGPARP